MKKKNEKDFYSFFNGSGLHRHFTGGRWPRPLSKKKAAATTTFIIIFFFFFLFLIVLVFAGWIDFSIFSGEGKDQTGSFLFIIFLNSFWQFKIVANFIKSSPLFVKSFFSGISSHKSILTPKQAPVPVPQNPEFPLICTDQQNIITNTTKSTSCPRNYPTSYPTIAGGLNPSRPLISVNVTCPSYFRWIHEDLRHWKESGITKNMVEGARRTAHFRLVILEGKAYVEKFRQSIQTRDMFTIWGILQLLRLYPGALPDLELMFDCDDRPVVRARDFRPGPKALPPPPLFRYCSDPWSLDIVFPDWSFWGWAECNIRPWKNVLADIKEGNKRTKWKDRVPYAYWKGNPNVAPTRRDLLKCNVSDKDDWNTRLYIQSWEEEKKQGFKKSNLEDQCTHRYKIYTEGWAWSVSEKYILACDSMTLYIRSRFHDFFIRGMEPLQHYWPIRENSKCTSLKFAVDWGNNHADKAQAIGEAASNFIQEDLKMEYVYDYMFHLLNEYAKLFKYKPIVPVGAVELCAETMGCPANGTWRNFMVESLVKSPSQTSPCSLPPQDPQAVSLLLERKASSTRQVEMWENEYWKNLNKKQ